MAVSASVARDDSAPSFNLTIGSGRSGIIEVTTSSSCFASESLRTIDNFYGTWSDSPRVHDGIWVLPDTVWAKFKASDAIYYRAGSAASEAGWDDYRVSTSDAQASSAPLVSIVASSATTVTNDQTVNANSNGGPSVKGPASWPRNSATPPQLVASTTAPYYIVEVSSDPSLFAQDGARTEDNFYATWQDAVDRLTTPDFTIPAPAWSHLRIADRLYYRIGTTTSASGWENYQVSTADDAAMTAPFISVL